jgi:ectoine hydroxylase-related dioxygenase (phytanoyl-CoA dioxygenase family)
MLTQYQLEEYESEGYLTIPQLIQPELLVELRILMDALMYNPLFSAKRVENMVNGNTYITNTDFMYAHHHLSCLYLLGSPFIQQIAATICGVDFISVQEFAVIKQLGDNTPVYWHQDMHHKGGTNCFTMGIYLDDAAQKDGALTIVPKSHRLGKSICELKDLPSIDVPVNAGDILIHDMLTAHCSGILSNTLIRRVIYFEFVNANYVLSEGLYSEQMIQNRLSFMNLARKYYTLCENNKQLQTNRFADSIYDELLMLERDRLPARPSAYCFPM